MLTGISCRLPVNRRAGTTIRGVFALRPCMTHHRSTDADVLALAEVAGELGSALAVSMLPG